MLIFCITACQKLDDIKSYQKTGLPVVEINTPNSEPITSKDTWTTGVTVSIVNTDNETIYQSTDNEIKGRGNSVWQMPKKPYALKLQKKAQILGMEKHELWCLMANYSDKTILRNEVAFGMSRDSQLGWTPSSKYVELVLNGKHQGVYQLCSQIKIDDNRVNVGNDGFLLEVDQLIRMTSDDVYFQTPRIVFNIKGPYVKYNSTEYQWIKDYVTNVENVLYSDDFLNPTTGYKTLVDINSFVDWYLINEIAKNNDACFYTSCYMNIKQNGKLCMGPVWDFDIGYGNINYNNNWETYGFWIADCPWIQRMFQDPEFVTLVKNRFNHFYNNKDTYIQNIITNSQNLSLSVEVNDEIWHTMNKCVWPNYVVPGSYSGEINYLVTWLNDRFEWLKNTYETMGDTY